MKTTQQQLDDHEEECGRRHTLINQRLSDLEKAVTKNTTILIVGAAIICFFITSGIGILALMI